MIPNPNEPKSDVICFKGSPALKRWLGDHGREYGLTTSQLLGSIVARYLTETVNRLSDISKVPVMRFIEDLKREAEIAIADGCITSEERTRITKPATGLLSWLYNRRDA